MGVMRRVIEWIKAFFAKIRERQESQAEKSNGSSGFSARPKNLFTRNEAAMFFALREIADGLNLFLLAKCRLVDVVDDRANYKRISAQHVDFVLCHGTRYTPVVVVELDGDTHDNNKQRQRDDKKDAALASARIPVVRVRIPWQKEKIAAVIREKIGAGG